MLAAALGHAIPTLRECGAFEPTAVVGGAAFDGLLALLRSTPPPEVQAARAALDEVRTELGVDAYDAAAARGAAMSPDEMFTYPLAELDDLIASFDA